jgi:alpha-L-fucosidase
MNIGPKSDGTIPDEVQQVLLSVGSWLKVNGEAIYGTRAWTTYGEGPTKVVEGSFNDTEGGEFTSDDFRFTTKGDTLYAIEMGWPHRGEAVIETLRGNVTARKPVQSVSLLGSPGTLTFAQKDDGLHIQLPAQNPGKYAYAYKIEFAK